jgi:pyridoxine 5-phosphate synthase
MKTILWYKSKAMIKLGINIDHLATLRNARGEGRPDLWRGAVAALRGGADSITVHLREDRRHIQDQDVSMLKKRLPVPLNLEIAPTEEIIEIACYFCPLAVCLVPERRTELTTEGGLNVSGNVALLQSFVARLRNAGSIVSLFIDPDLEQVAASAAVGADAIELHTGAYCLNPVRENFYRLSDAAKSAHEKGLTVHAGHGITYATMEHLRHLPYLHEVNIGHFLIAEAVFIGLEESVRRMKNIINQNS